MECVFLDARSIECRDMALQFFLAALGKLRVG